MDLRWQVREALMFTHQFFNIFGRIEKAKKFLYTLYNLGLLTESETRVLGHHIHSIILDEARNLK